METDFLTQKVIGCAIEVHKQLGPGLLENSYETCLIHELKLQNIDVKRQVYLPINYKGQSIDAGYRLDILIPSKLIIELKSIDKIAPIHMAQIMTYLKLSKIRTGLLINFNVNKLTDGLKRITI